MWKHKYEIDPTSIVEDTERTRFCPQMDGQMDGQTDKVKPVYPPFNFVEAGGIIMKYNHNKTKVQQNHYEMLWDKLYTTREDLAPEPGFSDRDK